MSECFTQFSFTSNQKEGLNMERFFITGVQLGMLQAMNNEDDRKKLVDEIVENQFIGNKEKFEKLLKELD